MGNKKSAGIVLLDNVGVALSDKSAVERQQEVASDHGANEQAVLKAELSRRAFTAIQQAGNGLVAAANDCEANVPSAKTIYVLAIVQGYIVDAQAALLEREHSGILAG